MFSKDISVNFSNYSPKGQQLREIASLNRASLFNKSILRLKKKHHPKAFLSMKKESKITKTTEKALNQH